MAREGSKTDPSVLIPCEDKYEAQKLASLILVRDPDTGDSQTFISAVVNTVGNEIVILLADGSSHSILLQDEAAVDAFADFVQSVTEKRDRLVTVGTCAAYEGASDDRPDGVPQSAVRISKSPR